MVNGEVYVAEEVNEENTGFFFDLFSFGYHYRRKAQRPNSLFKSCLSGIVFYAYVWSHVILTWNRIFLLPSASLDCREFAVLISEKNLSDADLSRLKETSLKLSVFIIALTYEYIRSSLLLTSRSSYQFHYMRLYMFKMLLLRRSAK